jgi:hypothetical protein
MAKQHNFEITVDGRRTGDVVRRTDKDAQKYAERYRQFFDPDPATGERPEVELVRVKKGKGG